MAAGMREVSRDGYAPASDVIPGARLSSYGWGRRSPLDHLSHLSLLLGVGLVVPLVVYLVKKDTSPRVSHHAREALNFHISIMIYSFACAVTCILIPLAFVIAVGGMVFAIIAATKASDPVLYEYPLTLRLVK